MSARGGDAALQPLPLQALLRRGGPIKPLERRAPGKNADRTRADPWVGEDAAVMPALATAPSWRKAVGQPGCAKVHHLRLCGASNSSTCGEWFGAYSSASARLGAAKVVRRWPPTEEPPRGADEQVPPIRGIGLPHGFGAGGCPRRTRSVLGGHPCADGQDALSTSPCEVQFGGSYSPGSRPSASFPRASRIEGDCRASREAADLTHARLCSASARTRETLEQVGAGRRREIEVRHRRGPVYGLGQ